ncbi:CUB domain protein, partial [Ostertagia ostertagi]
MFLALVALIFLGSVESSKKSSLPKSARSILDNLATLDAQRTTIFYYNGIISSPYYPKLYPPNTECYYYMTAEPGKVLRLGGPNATVTTPDKLYTTTQRFALVTFQSDPVVQKTGFQFVYQSVFSECHSSGIFKYAQGAVSFEAKENKEREGVEKVVIAFDTEPQ